MKTGKKILLAILLVIVAMVAVGVYRFVQEENRFKEYSTYCMDKIRSELGDYLENIYMVDSVDSEGIYVYMGGVGYGGVDYKYSCKVYDKDNVDLKLSVEEDKLSEVSDDCAVGDNNVCNAEMEVSEEYISYYDNGSIRQSGTYIDGFKQGDWITYDEEGNIIEVEKYEDGKMVYKFIMVE